MNTTQAQINGQKQVPLDLPPQRDIPEDEK